MRQGVHGWCSALLCGRRTRATDDSAPLMVLTRSEFRQACETFIHKHEASHLRSSDELTGRSTRDWQWHQHSVVPGLGYMARVGYALRKQGFESAAPCLSGDSLVEELEEEDNSTLPSQTPSSQVVTVQQYIVYSPTFQVPAFYFTIHDSNGTPLPLQDIIGTSLFRAHSFPQSISTAPHGISMPDSNFPLLSQGDHPVLGTPCWYFHPCETSVAVTELLEAANNGGEEDKEDAANKKSLRWLEAWFLVLCSVVDLR